MENIKYFSELVPPNFLDMVLKSKTNIHLIPAGTGIGKSKYLMDKIVRPAHMKTTAVR